MYEKIAGSYPTYEEWKLDYSKLNTHNIKVLILPMRNGNNKLNLGVTFEVVCSYPTYEEWKHLSSKAMKFHTFPGSYPTYEEWKQANANIGMNNTFSSYPTYEEWKLSRLLP